MKLYDIKETVTDNQKEITARGITSKNWKLFNTKNNGCSPLDTDWNQRESIVIAAGTWVDYTLQETHAGNVHSISYKIDNDTFSRTITK